MVPFKQYITEIALSKFDNNIQQRIDNFCNIALGEKIPYEFKDDKTHKIIIPANKKLSKSIIIELVLRWLDGDKFYLNSTDGNQKNAHIVMSKILNCIEPDHEWFPGTSTPL